MASADRSSELRAIRESTGLTQTQLARMAGTSARSTYTDWESGKAMPDAPWQLLSARVALYRGDKAQALAVLRETLPARA